ncbi:F-box/FBD/LRR-repeat protein At5g18770 isoform X2 [Brachypodium distachyon]|uniref:F-box/FBD/LRR-repeat protein At5g18770 isoform X2 n=1 Tax=Brachypodium distachyon TaxID=15368 RepID=UPI000D0E062E|nr:F-box/FBD/LRR-repeat protein At5g18770 isoform X2 [Brachypodium distachyon]|eukprot:XP_024310928.1 F-box/FBD/LRR-repeat protein At5g18770 isoform X2 [Brachypodium distachyon]
MPRRGSENQANKRPATTAGGDDDEDRLSALPDPLLQHVLSFLPSRLAVRTCALARRWRHQWKSVPAVRVKCSDFANNNLLRCFVNHFLPLRDRAPLLHFPKDLKKSPSFGKLKTLLLSEWCFADKFGALMYFLQHSPVLEKLSLELTTSESLFETHGSCYQREPFLASKHLKVVEVKYHEDEVFALAEVLKILITCGVPSKKIIIESMTSRISHRFNFEQTVKQFSH